MNEDCFYFGCWSEPGHFLHAPNGRRIYNLPSDFPVSEHALDAALLPPNQPEIEGRATFVHINGWTILAFWDRSIDKRGKCNSTFILRGIHSFDAACHQMRECFPTVWGRFKFDVKLPG